MQKILPVTGIMCAKCQKQMYVISLIHLFVLKTSKHTRLYHATTLQHQASNGKGKNNIRKRRDILVFDCDPQRFVFISPP